MLYREIITVCSQTHTKHINTVCWQTVGFVCVKDGGTYSDQMRPEVLKSLYFLPECSRCEDSRNVGKRVMNKEPNVRV